MNFLAHLTLSDNDEDLMLGNFIADRTRKSDWKKMKPRVVEGIELHLKIDFFTDHHFLTEKAKEKLRPTQRKYSPVVLDILYDHFLAKNFTEYYDENLEDFAKKCYQIFRKRWTEIPKNMYRMIDFMEHQNWLVSYADLDGLNRALSGMSRRANFQNQMNSAVLEVRKNYDFYEKNFREFYPLLQDFVDREILEII